jgi:glycosyltransferase involved in cell wall biosynthesis
MIARPTAQLSSQTSWSNLTTKRVTHYSRNEGKTRALSTGFALTRGDIVIVQDADLE